MWTIHWITNPVINTGWGGQAGNMARGWNNLHKLRKKTLLLLQLWWTIAAIAPQNLWVELGIVYLCLMWCLMIYINDVGYTICLTRYKDTVFKKGFDTYYDLIQFRWPDPLRIQIQPQPHQRSPSLSCQGATGGGSKILAMWRRSMWSFKYCSDLTKDYPSATEKHGCELRGSTTCQWIS